MQSVELIRLEKGGQGTFGVLRLDGEVFCVTLEPPERGNLTDISCIPAGRYRCRRVVSPRFGETFEVTGVPGRSQILVHAGNLAADTRGCVLVGRRYGVLGSERAVLESKATFAEFMDRCRGADDFEFRVEDACGGGSWTTSA